MSSGTEKKEAKPFDAKEEITKLYGKMKALEEKISQEREANQKLKTEIAELHKETSKGLGECDPEKVIYQPRYSTKNPMRLCYAFGDNDPFYLHFVGYGSSAKLEDYESHQGLSFTACTGMCKLKQNQDKSWNALNFEWEFGTCTCVKSSSGFAPHKDYVMYEFTR